jgi:hypothetical protein
MGGNHDSETNDFKRTEYLFGARLQGCRDGIYAGYLICRFVWRQLGKSAGGSCYLVEGTEFADELFDGVFKLIPDSAGGAVQAAPEGSYQA